MHKSFLTSLIAFMGLGFGVEAQIQTEPWLSHLDGGAIEMTVEQTMASIEAGDFLTLFFILHPDQQEIISRAILVLQTDVFISPEALEHWGGFGDDSLHSFSSTAATFADMVGDAAAAGTSPLPDFSPWDMARLSTRAGLESGEVVASWDDGREYIFGLSTHGDRWRLSYISWSNGEHRWPRT